METTKIIPFFDYSRIYADYKKEFGNILEDIGTRGAYIMQKDLTDFEDNLSKFVGSEYAIGVGNATDGLELSWLAIGLKKGDEVIISSHTMVATASAIITAGGIPVPVDIGPDNLINPEAISAAINKNTVGISPTHLNGRTCNMESIMQIASNNKLAVVEDAAQALGSKYRNKCAGTFGDTASFSFFPAKVLGALGDGGGVTTSNSLIYDKVFQLHDHGRDKNGNIQSWGRNSRLDNFQAAILNYKLKNYSQVIQRRRFIANLYDEQLRELPQLQLPPAPTEYGENFDVYQNYEIQADSRDRLRKYLSNQGIGTLIQWGGKAIHQWNALGFNLKIPNVELFFERCLMLPMNTFLSDDDVIYICEAIKNFYIKES
jgi:dTDP-4-amino-4,6-dideoxygalactose transaminase